MKLIQRMQSLVTGSLYRMTDRIADRLAGAPRVGRIAINMRPQASSWGGGNQWVLQMTKALRAEGYSVRFDLAQPVDGILMVDPRPSDQVSFGPDEIRQAKNEQPTTFCLHRINENDQRKQTKIMDTPTPTQRLITPFLSQSGFATITPLAGLTFNDLTPPFSTALIHVIFIPINGPR
jgi:hypothetical protein